MSRAFVRFARCALLSLGLVGALAAPPARTEEPSKEALAKAREEFRRGLALEVAKDYEGALSVFKGVALVKSSPQVRFHIGVCEEAVGEWVSPRCFSTITAGAKCPAPISITGGTGST